MTQVRTNPVEKTLNIRRAMFGKNHPVVKRLEKLKELYDRKIAKRLSRGK